MNGKMWLGILIGLVTGFLVGTFIGGPRWPLFRQQYKPIPPTVPIAIVVDQGGGTVQPIPFRAYAYRGQLVEWHAPTGELDIDWKQGQNPSGLLDPSCQASTAVRGWWTCSVMVPKNAPYGTNRYTVKVTIGTQQLKVDPEVVIQG